MPRMRALICGRGSWHASSWLFCPAQHGRSRNGGIAGLDADIDDGDIAGFDRGDCLLEGRDQIVLLEDRAEALRALRARKRSNVDVGLGDALADPAILRRPRADAGDALLMQLVIEE